MGKLRFAGNRALAGAAEEVRLQLDRGESDPAVGQAQNAAVAARGVREPDHRGCMEVAVRRVMVAGELHPPTDDTVFHGLDLAADVAGEEARAGLVQPS